MPRERLPMRKISDVLRLHAGGLSKRRIAVSLNIGPHGSRRLHQPRGAARVWAGRWPRIFRTRNLETAAVPAACGGFSRSPVDSRLAGAASRVEAARRHPVPVVGRVPRGPSGRLRLQPVLRTLPCLEGRARPDHASEPCGRREDVRRLCRRHPRGDRRPLPARSARPRSSSPPWAPPVTPTPRRPGRKRCPTGLARTAAPSPTSAGVAAQVVPDNLKSGVVKACLYDPEINRTYAGMAAHYDTAIVPARPRKPRDKAKVEVSVQIVERWVLARLRNRRFFSLAELKPGHP